MPTKILTRRHDKKHHILRSLPDNAPGTLIQLAINLLNLPDIAIKIELLTIKIQQILAIKIIIITIQINNKNS